MTSHPGIGPLRRGLATLLALLALLGSVGPLGTARAQSRELDWQDEWRRYGAVDAGVTVGLAALGLLINELAPNRMGRRGEGILFDEPARDALRLGEGVARRRARTTSDVLLATMIAWPVVDSLAVWGRGEGDTGLQLFGVTSLAFASTYGLLSGLKRLVGRPRPYARLCGSGQLVGEPFEDCRDEDRFRSFPSGHVAYTFTGASLVCTSHLHLPVYGRRGADITACATALAVAFTTGLLRMMGDVHYATDVVGGAFLGALSGFLLPSLLYYGFDGNGPPF